MPVPGQSAGVPQVIEPPTVTYRDVTVHNPRYAGGLSVWGYSKEEIKRDCDAIVQNAGSDKKCKCPFRPFPFFSFPDFNPLVVCWSLAAIQCPVLRFSSLFPPFLCYQNPIN
jgi:hypothetical protein